MSKSVHKLLTVVEFSNSLVKKCMIYICFMVFVEVIVHLLSTVHEFLTLLVKECNDSGIFVCVCF